MVKNIHPCIIEDYLIGTNDEWINFMCNHCVHVVDDIISKHSEGSIIKQYL